MADGTRVEARMRFFFLNLGHAYVHLLPLLYPTVVIALEAQGLGEYGELLLPATAGFVTYAALTLPAGWLGDHWSRHHMMTIMFVGLGVACLLTAMADGTLQLMMGLGLIGAFAAIYHPVGIAMVAETSEKVGRAMGINGVWGNMGVAAAPLTAGLLTAALGWRAAFIVPGIICLLTGLAFLLLVKPAPQGAKAKVRGAAVAPDPRLVFRVFGYIVVSALLGGVVFAVMTVALPKMVEESRALIVGGLVTAAGLTAAIFAVASFAQLPAGWAVDKFSPRRLMLAIAGLQVPLFLWLSMGEGWTAILLCFLVMVLVFGGIPIQDTLIARYAAAAWRARVYSIKYVLTFAVNAVAVPLIAWLYRPEIGFQWLYLLLGVCAMSVAAAAMLLPARRPDQVETTTQTAPGEATGSPAEAAAE